MSYLSVARYARLLVFNVDFNFAVSINVEVDWNRKVDG